MKQEFEGIDGHMPDVISQICVFLHAVMKADYHVRSPYLLPYHAPMGIRDPNVGLEDGELPKFGILFETGIAPEDLQPFDSVQMNEFMDDMQEAIDDLEEHPSRDAMLNSDLFFGNDGKTIYFSNPEDLVTVLYAMSEISEHYWEKIEDIPDNIDGEASRALALEDLDTFVAGYYQYDFPKSRLPKAVLQIPVETSMANHPYLMLKKAHEAVAKVRAEETEAEPENPASEEEGQELPDLAMPPEIAWTMAAFMEEAVYADYEIDGIEIIPGYSNGKLVFAFDYAGYDDPEQAKIQESRFELFIHDFIAATKKMGLLVGEKKLGKEHLDIRFNPETADLEVGSYETLLVALTHIADIGTLNWNKRASDFSSIPSDMPIDDEKRERADLILKNESDLIDAGRLDSERSIMFCLLAGDGYVSKDDMARDVLRMASFFDDDSVRPRPLHTLDDIERLIVAHNTETQIQKPSYYKMGLWPQ
jgi:hypothetical protein